ncbi:MAG: response regulator [Desulfovibrio sp.]|nr:response regulator [Desulfovibrio sp.]
MTQREANWASDMFRRSEADWNDVVLLDMCLSEMDGIGASQSSRTLARSDARMVSLNALTARALGEDVRQSKQAGLIMHLSKPVEPEKLFETL